jgi:hypothetical protein
MKALDADVRTITLPELGTASRTEVAPFDLQSQDQSRAKGHAADATPAGRAATVALAAGAIVAIAAALWTGQ